MSETLSNLLHDKLDAMGAPPRETSQEKAGESPQVEVVEAGESPGPDAAAQVPEPVEIPQSEGADGEAEADAPATGEIPEKYKPADLAEAIGWEAKDLYNDLVVPMSSGESLSLGEMKDRYDGLTAREAEVNTAREKLEQQAQEYQQQIAQAGQGMPEEIAKSIGQIEAIKASYVQHDWDALEKENPGQAANLRQKFAVALQQAQAEHQKLTSELQVKQQAEMQKTLIENDKRLLELVPEWKEPAKFQAEQAGIQEYLVSMGFTPVELQGVVHAGARAVARDAWLWRQHQDEVSKAKGRVRKAPKAVIRPGGPPKQVIADKRVAELENRARATGRQTDRLAAARAIVQSLSKR